MSSSLATNLRSSFLPLIPPFKLFLSLFWFCFLCSLPYFCLLFLSCHLAFLPFHIVLYSFFFIHPFLFSSPSYLIYFLVNVLFPFRPFMHVCYSFLLYIIHLFFLPSYSSPPSFLPSPPNSFFLSFIHTISINLFFVRFLLFSIPSFHSLLPSFLPSFLHCVSHLHLPACILSFPYCFFLTFLILSFLHLPSFFLSLLSSMPHYTFLPAHIFFLHSFPLPSLPVSFLFSYP